MVIVEKVDLTPPLDGIIYVAYNEDNATLGKHYHMIVNKYPWCLCTSYSKMHNSNIGGKQPYGPCNHMYNLFWLVLHVDEEENVFIHNT